VNEAEARAIALERIRELRALNWEDVRVRYLKNPEAVEVTGPSGTTYQVETEAFWDGAKDADLRVIVSVDDGGWRAFMPLTEDFILSRDGSFVDE